MECCFTCGAGFVRCLSCLPSNKPTLIRCVALVWILRTCYDVHALMMTCVLSRTGRRQLGSLGAPSTGRFDESLTDWPSLAQYSTAVLESSFMTTRTVTGRPSKDGAFTRCCFNVGSASLTLAQH